MSDSALAKRAAWDLMRETWRQLMTPVFEHAYDKDEWYDVYNKPEQLELFRGRPTHR